jgi:FdrA protein
MAEDKRQPTTKPAPLLAAPPRVINIGLERFAEDLAAQGATVQHVQWIPPAGGDAQLADLLSKLGS